MKKVTIMKSTEKAAPSKMKKEVMMTAKSSKKKSFPDMNKDGKVTKKDVLIAKGVITKKK